MTTAATGMDPITLEIIQSSLQAISDEMFAAFRKTAMSAIIYEVLDMGTAVTDAEGELASSGAGIPAFVGVLDKAVKRIIELNGAEKIRAGDIFATNDPFYGGVTHLNDVVLAMPVFADGELVAWTANIAHWNDVGGIVPGSISNEAKEIYQEGLRLPGVKLIAGGKPIRSVMEIMKANSRLPDFLQGDMWAGIAAARVGERRILDLVDKYGRETFVTALRVFMEYGEQVALRALDDLPKGRFELSEEQDSGVVYSVTVEISDDEFVVDLSENPDQDPGPNNASRDGSMVAAQMVFMNVTGAHASANAGHFKPLRLLTRQGSVFDAMPPAAFGIYYEVEIRLYDLIWRCLAPHLGNTLPAGSFASICGTFIGGPHPDTGKHFTIVEPQVGGWGASAFRDGNSAIFSGFHGDTFNAPAEVAEARYGLYVDRLALNDEPGGEGEHRGGKGIVLEYRVRSNGCFFTCAYTRNKHKPWPLAGGCEGTANRAEVIRTDGTVEEYAVVTALEVNEGDVIRIHTGNGGGYGDPRRRARELVLDDIRNGYVAEARARFVYELYDEEALATSRGRVGG
ncbi:MAG TPA: hydantoinase B/oxoprolinase family protein [Candidatus Caenarcaniphilales bacterium]|nr:hydantoinase B/oxoprolinase family protein [Candidatus Caenarcaniphilales bacterium]